MESPSYIDTFLMMVVVLAFGKLSVCPMASRVVSEELLIQSQRLLESRYFVLQKEGLRIPPITMVLDGKRDIELLGSREEYQYGITVA